MISFNAPGKVFVSQVGYGHRGVNYVIIIYTFVYLSNTF